MKRMLTTALALALAGGVYLSGGTANASNMGFKLERSFTHTDGLRNLYFVAFPLFNGVGDVCNEGADPVCTSLSGGPGDDMITACDAACDLWTDIGSVTSGAFALQRVNPLTCEFLATTINRSAFGTTLAAGPGVELEPLRDIAWAVTIAQDVDTDNRAVIVGSHDPSYAGYTLPDPDNCRLAFINTPYHTMYRTADEILCGLETVDWDDTDGDGNPDSCPNGIWDPVSKVLVAVQTFENLSGFAARSVSESGFGFSWGGADFDLEPGLGYVVNTDPGYTPRVYLTPHF